MNDLIYFSGEDALASALAKRCASEVIPNYDFVNIQPIRGGVSEIKKNIISYFRIGMDIPFFLMLDQDNYECPPSLRSELIGLAGVTEVPRKMVFSIVTREAEAWLLGDQEQLSNLLNITVQAIPDDPESLLDPKKTLVDLARKGKKLRHELCPDTSTSAKVGPEYNSVLTRFASYSWRPSEAARRCKSLARTLDRLQQLSRM